MVTRLLEGGLMAPGGLDRNDLWSAVEMGLGSRLPPEYLLHPLAD